MTQTDMPAPIDAPEGITTPRGRGRRHYGVLAAIAFAVLIISGTLGNLAHASGGPTEEATVIGRCRAVDIARATHHTKNDFTSVVIGQSTAVRHPDQSWTVVEPVTLSGHIVNGVRDADRVSITKTCEFSEASARSRTAPAERVKVHFDGTRANFSQEFALDSSGTSYAFVDGEGLQGP